MKTRRDKVAPQALIAPRKEGLADLADRVLTLIYGPHAEIALNHRLMHEPPASDAKDLIVGADAEVIELLKSQILYALGSGQIVLAVELDTSSFQKRKEPHTDLGEFTIVDDDNKSDFPAEWVVAPRFWNNSNSAASISWKDSIIHVPPDYIYESLVGAEINPPFKHWHPLARYFDNLPPEIKTTAYVANPDVALRRFFKFGPLPNEQQAAAYRSAIADLVKEATAVAWRYLAISGAGREFNQRELVRQMISYLRKQNLYDDYNFRPSEGTLLVVARKVHEQFKQTIENLEEHAVYVSSTPESARAVQSRRARGVRAPQRK